MKKPRGCGQEFRSRALLALLGELLQLPGRIARTAERVRVGSQGGLGEKCNRRKENAGISRYTHHFAI
ncbi:MAG: hypothetical protein ACE5JI_10720, partial [Acidobacteriota bacterium]